MDSGAEAGGALVIVIAPQTDKFDPDDDRWRAQMADFYQSLESEVEGVRRDFTPVEGTKGGAETVILALGSAGAFTAAVQFFRAWLGRDKSRSVEISWGEEGGKKTVSVRGDAIDEDAIQVVADAAAKRLSEDPWPTPGTKPS